MGGIELVSIFGLPYVEAMPAQVASEKRTNGPKAIAGGVVHDLPTDFADALTRDPEALATWHDITPLARNEWICWIESAKKSATRAKRIDWGCSNLRDGKRRPCCWPGCPHR